MSPAVGCSTHSRPTAGSDAPFLLIANTPQASRRHKKAAVAGVPKHSPTYCRASGCARRFPFLELMFIPQQTPRKRPPFRL